MIFLSTVAILAPSKREFAGIQPGAYELLLALVTGLGRSSAVTSTKSALRHPFLLGVISIGFAGGLDPELETGDLVICSRTMTQEHSSEPWTPTTMDQTLLETVLKALATTAYRTGALLTVPSPLLHPGDKEAAFEASGAAVVDMEGHWIAMECRKARVPFVGLRTVLDTAQDRLPKLAEDIVAAKGQREKLIAATYIARRPWETIRLCLLWRKAQRTSATINAVLNNLLIVSMNDWHSVDAP